MNKIVKTVGNFCGSIGLGPIGRQVPPDHRVPPVRAVCWGSMRACSGPIYRDLRPVVAQAGKDVGRYYAKRRTP